VPPILLAGVRFSISGPLMLAFCAATGRRVRVTPGTFLRLAFVGILLLAFSNVVLAWAEFYVPTGLAALISSIVPIWFLLIELAATGGERPAGRGLAGIGLGIVGVGVLLWPSLGAARQLGWLELAGIAALFGSSFTWALGSVIGRRWRIAVDPLVGSGWQMAVAGGVDLLLGLALGQQHRTIWDARGVGAVLYLVVFGSLVGYSAYVWLLEHVPTSKVATYAYVNPVVAVFLGWLVRGEAIDRYIVLGSVIIVPAVALVTSAKVGRGRGK
jgi:drug/metabolite transporter (DMT)-like permease